MSAGEPDCIDEVAMITSEFIVGEYRGRAFILCRQCGARSYHPDDIRKLYCSVCHRWHEALTRGLSPGFLERHGLL